MGAIVLVQFFCALIFLSEIAISVFGLSAAPIDWYLYELIQIGAAVGLLMGTGLGMVALYQMKKRTEAVETQLRVASGALAELLDERFAEWGLTPAEQDVALFVIKGMSTDEVAGLRSTSVGTVKAQTNAIYRKAGVSGRAQLVSLFVEDLMGEALVSQPSVGSSA